MKVALFGRSGFIGSRVAEVLQRQSIAYTGVSRSQAGSDTVVVNYQEPASFASIPNDVDAAIICSSKLPQKAYSLQDTKDFIGSNVIGLLNTLEWAKNRKLSRIVYCSTLSMLVDNGAHYPYKISKAAAENLFTAWCREQQVPYIVLRIASVYGPGMKPDVLSVMIDAARNGKVFTLSNKQASADLVYVDDVATALVAALTTAPNRIIDASSGAPALLFDVWKTIAGIVGTADATIEVKADQPTNAPIYSPQEFNSLLKGKQVTLEAGLKELVKTSAR